jgi:hypothetical protein
MPRAGALIALEGSDDVVLDTLLERLYRWLRGKGIPVERAEAPTRSPIGALLRLQQQGRLRLDPPCRALLWTADRLDQLSHLEVREARAGDQVGPGMVFLAPGGYHMTVATNGEIQLDQGPTECGVRPSVNVTMESAARVYGGTVLGVVLTGMGSDGTRGATMIKGAGGKVIVQDEGTCAVYGMPASVVEAGKADKVMPLPYIADEIVQMCHERSARPKQRAKAKV